MELTTLRYFVTVAHELHFRRAAAKLYMTQGPLSAAIKKLEEELGTLLFERSSRFVRLTPEGEFFLSEAEAVLNRSQLALERLKKRLADGCERLSIGYNEPALYTFLPGLLSVCRRSFPGIRLELREMETLEQINALQEDELDIGFMRPYGFDLKGLQSKLVYREHYQLAMPGDSRLTVKEKISLEDISDREIILFAREVNPQLFDLLVQKLSLPGLPPPRFRQDARNKNSVLAMVEAGFGAALLPESCLKDRNSGIEFRPVSAVLPAVEIMAVWKSAKSPPLLDHISFDPEKFSLELI